jgi:glucokinase
MRRQAERRANVEIVAADIGGTHARFAIAEVEGGKVVRLGPETTLKTAHYASLQTAWESFGQQAGRALPAVAGLAVACPVHGEVLKFTNNPWVIRVSALKGQLKLDHLTLINDFAAIGHAVAHLDNDQLKPLCGPATPIPPKATLSVIGPGTGLGVAQVLRHNNGYEVIATEAGHISFAPIDRIEDAILAHLRSRYVRVSAERIVSGPGLANLYEALAAIEGKPVLIGDDKALWAAALEGADSLAVAALDRFCLSFGSFAGDMALAHGAGAVIIAGSLAARIGDTLCRSGFAQRFAAKGRFEAMMTSIPVRLIAHPQPGLFGAAAAVAVAMQGGA